MNAVQRPQAYGVFKPVGHVIVALPSENDRDDAVAGLLQAGFVAEDIHAYTPSEMIAQADDEIAHASALAGVGQELNLVKAHRELAQQGSSFLVVRAHDTHEAEQIAEVATRCHASRAQRYGSLVIEELIPVGGSQRQVAESTDRGLDAQTRSGHEKAQAGTPR
ncbi:MAG TPA: hypothetical protein VGM74_11645 [Burkholderiaceae bacterium]|jgi:hypothetical protein